ncbi:hypothetical protein NITGR_270011 [Nitrospina gracilis 3/211]|uniref:Uncharacterized protein n=1 Tax=Nitrospina gracilis (strain 3/211) TaxID=1266370 RepID=M1YXQ0_NITG3|nr:MULTISPECIES: hypothetical protein [Nitrospina]MCF8723205.1 putative amidophosphoribosyltransferase [Nitrospina sp. Nb-3]CCQ90251.1 hypothetical protein NITGR_270011 [Nitrospina gracilis 3/211]
MIQGIVDKTTCCECNAPITNWSVRCSNCGEMFPAGNIHVMMARGFGIILALALAVAVTLELLQRI